MADTRAPEHDEPLAMSWTVGRVLAVLVGLAIVVFWAWILTGGPRRPNPDRLEDRAWADMVATRCERMLEELDEIPTAAATTSHQERAVNVRAANDVITSMVDDLERVEPTDASDAENLDLWFADWRVYLADRATYADRVATDPGATFQITENEELGRGVDDTIKTFAEVNDLPDCRPPGDVG